MESDELGAAAVTALNGDVASGGLASTFSSKAAERNEVVVVTAGIADVAVTIADVVELEFGLDVSEMTYAMIGTIQMTMVLTLFVLWAYAARNMRTKAPEKSKVFPAPLETVEAIVFQPDATLDAQDRHLQAATKHKGVADSASQSASQRSFKGYHPLDIVQAAATHCG